jgi:hypothetical protein
MPGRICEEGSQEEVLLHRLISLVEVTKLLAAMTALLASVLLPVSPL